MSKLRNGELPPLTGIFTNCKICNESKDDAHFKYQHGKRAGLVCRLCSNEIKRKEIKDNEWIRMQRMLKAREYYHENKEKTRIASASYRERNKEKIKADKQKYHVENSDRINAKTRQWYIENKDRHSKNSKAYYEANKNIILKQAAENYLQNKIEYNKRSSEWRKNNPHMMTAYTRNYNLSKTNRTPKWSNIKETNDFYKNCPDRMSIDHIHPLNGKLINGLHVRKNLQYISRSENSKKSNKFNTYWVFYEQRTIRVETSGPKSSIFKIKYGG